jgi:hypothetical protein
MRRVISEFGGVRASLVSRLRRLEANDGPRVRFVWLEPGESIEQKRAALIASGEIDAGTELAGFRWKDGSDDTAAQAAAGG